MSLLRGAQVGNQATLTDIQELVSLRANIMRYEAVAGTEANNWENTKWLNWWYGHIEQVKIIRSNFPKLNIAFSLHTPPGGRNPDGTMKIFSDPSRANTLILGWKEATSRLRGHKIQFFDLINEPGGTAAETNLIYERIVNVVSRRNAYQHVIVSSAYGDPLKFHAVKYINNPHVHYTAHFYLPLKFTHQGIYGYPVGMKYPNYLTLFTKLRLKRYLKQVREFSLLHKTQIFIGEFSCSNFTDTKSKYNYLRDCIALFEAYGFNWCYHAWREASVWQPSPSILGLLKHWWAKN